MKQNHWTIKYRSLTYTYLMRSIFVSHWSIIQTTMFIHQIILKILSNITTLWNIGHADLYLLWGQSFGHTVSLSENMTLIHQIVLRYKTKSLDHEIKVTVTYIYFEVKRHTDSYSQSIVYTSNCLQDIRQNHWTVKYRSCWPSLHDPHVHVTRLSHVWPTICISCFNTRKSRKALFKGVLVFDL